jgi:hypothetical protein
MVLPNRIGVEGLTNLSILLNNSMCNTKLRKYTKEFLEPKVKEINSITKLIELLGLKLNGGNYRLLKQRIRQHEISTDHFTGPGWSKGLTKETSESVRKTWIKSRTPDGEVFCINSGFSPSKLKKRLLELNWKNECNICGLYEWMGNPITLHVDHINGISGDNRLENLQIICPNCHQQTETWGNKNGSVVKLVSTERLGRSAEMHESSSLSTPTNNCIDCSGNCSKRSKRCKSCEAIRKNGTTRKRVSKEQLIEDLDTIKTYVGIGKKYGVSDVSIKKWCKFYELTYK